VGRPDWQQKVSSKHHLMSLHGITSPLNDASTSNVLSTVGPAVAAAAAAATNQNQHAASATCTQLLLFWSAGARSNATMPVGLHHRRLPEKLWLMATEQLSAAQADRALYAR
jgi:hypothetical protein